MRFVVALADKITVLNSGSVIAEGTPEEIQANPNVIEVYLGKKYRVAASHCLLTKSIEAL